MYDERPAGRSTGSTARRRGQVNRNAGAESTIEALLALQRVTRNPDAAEYLRYRPVGELWPTRWRTFRISASSPVPAERASSCAGSRPGSSSLECTRRRHDSDHADLLARRESRRDAARDPARRAVERARTRTCRCACSRCPPAARRKKCCSPRSSHSATPDVSSNVSSALLARLVRAGGVVRLDNRVADGRAPARSARRRRCSRRFGCRTAASTRFRGRRIQRC